MDLAIYHISSIIAEAFNLRNLMKSLPFIHFKLIVNCISKHYRVTNHFIKLKVCQLQFLTSSTNSNAVNNTHYTMLKHLLVPMAKCYSKLLRLDS